MTHENTKKQTFQEQVYQSGAPYVTWVLYFSHRRRPMSSSHPSAKVVYIQSHSVVETYRNYLKCNSVEVWLLYSHIRIAM